jgi:signal-transduction protein with cAMP-binding, CBS, and nucleotidyltransferase domain
LYTPCPAEYSIKEPSWLMSGLHWPMEDYHRWSWNPQQNQAGNDPIGFSVGYIIISSIDIPCYCP